MSPELRSFVLGTITLDVLLMIALGLTLTGGPVPSDGRLRRRLIGLFGAAIAVQGLHFVEEWATGFAGRFPAMFGLHPWSEPFWVKFNLTWIGIWCLSIFGLHRRWRVALLPVWFLALACLINLIAHPLLALAAGGYFPGLWSSPLCGLVGVPLLKRLGRLTRNGASSPLAA